MAWCWHRRRLSVASVLWWGVWVASLSAARALVKVVPLPAATTHSIRRREPTPLALSERRRHEAQHQRTGGRRRCASTTVVLRGTATTVGKDVFLDVPDLPDVLATPVDVTGDGGVLKVRSAGATAESSLSDDDDDDKKVFAEDGAVARLRYAAREGGGRGQLVAASEGDFAYTVGDVNWLPCFDVAVRSLRVGEKARFECRADYCYGPAGLPPLLGPNVGLVLDVEALDYRGNIFSSATFAQDKPLTPRTATEIKAEYERRKAARARAAREEALADADLGPLEKALKTIRSFYFFGFFESQTGQTPPWYLRPLITFPAIFAAVAISFYFLISNDVILLKGAGPTIPGETPFTLE